MTTLQNIRQTQQPRLAIEPLEMRAMLTTFFVDGATGDDANPGTEEEPLATIQAAIDAADETISPGKDTVIVQPGTYTENLTIDDEDPLTIRGGGDNPQDVIIQDDDGLDDVITMIAGDVTLARLQVTGGRNGIVASGHSLTLRRVDATGNGLVAGAEGDGVHADSLKRLKIVGGDYSGNGDDGIEAVDASRVTILGARLGSSSFSTFLGSGFYGGGQFHLTINNNGNSISQTVSFSRDGQHGCDWHDGRYDRAIGGGLWGFRSFFGAWNSRFAPRDALYVDGASGDDSNPGTKEEPLQTIQAAIDAADETNSPGKDTIVVQPGTYTENLTIDDEDPLTIRGNGDKPADVVIQDDDGLDDVINMNSGVLTLAHLQVTGGRNGIVASGDSLTLKNVEATGNGLVNGAEGDGVHANELRKLTIFGGDYSGNGDDDIQADDTTRLTVFEGHRHPFTRVFHSHRWFPFGRFFHSFGHGHHDTIFDALRRVFHAFRWLD